MNYSLQIMHKDKEFDTT